MTQNQQSPPARGITAVLYHKHCQDGMGAAWAASKALTAASFHPMNYGDPLPDLQSASSIVIVDFSLPRDIMLQLHQQLGAENVTLLDHHLTAQRNLHDLPNCKIDMDHSGAVLSWQHFKPEQPVPKIMQYVQDRDLWRWELPDSRAVNAYIASWSNDATCARWDYMSDNINYDIGQVIQQGEAILRTQETLIRQAVNTVQIISIDDNPVPAVESAVLQSEIAELLLLEFRQVPFAVVHHDDGEFHKFSLRARPDGHDVAATCERLGGGGHQAAAGFRIPSDRNHIALIGQHKRVEGQTP